MTCRLCGPGEVGSCDLIRSAAAEVGAVLQKFELDGQFRCAGSEEFIRWVDATLGITKQDRMWQPDGQFDFRIFDGVQDMAEAIRAKATNGYSAPSGRRLLLAVVEPRRLRPTRGRRQARWI